MRALLLLWLALAIHAGAREVTFAWDANPEPDVTGYRLYRFDETAQQWRKIAEVAGIEATVSDFPNVRTRVHATAINAAGLESQPSNEVAVDPDPPSPPGGVRRKIVSLQISRNGADWETIADYFLPDEQRLFARLTFRDEDAQNP